VTHSETVFFMSKQTLKSLSDLSALKEYLDDTKLKNTSTADESINKKRDAQFHSNVAADGVSRWEPIHKLLSNKLFEAIASGSVNKISSKNYSIVIAVLTYPTMADAYIRQEQLDQAHDIALRIKRGLKSGHIKYTNAKIPSPWRIGGNPGTKK
jgi:hypothetical protein